jgi:hypothetical protein
MPAGQKVNHELMRANLAGFHAEMPPAVRRDETRREFWGDAEG